MNNYIYLLLLIFSGDLYAQAKMKSPEREIFQPNIIIIMADDLASNELSCYGGKNIITPNIDRLAKEGMKFNQVYASEAMCVPIRASLFTGLYPVRHGSFQNHKPVKDNVKSIGHYLGNLGYRVALTGKDHSTKPRSVFPFEIIDGFETNCVARTADYSLDGIKSLITKADKPYCLFVMSTNPHAPWTVGDPTEFDPQKLLLPPNWVDSKKTREHFSRYLAEVRRLDDEVGDVLKLLNETGQDKNTVVIFLGEQGPQFPGGKWTSWDHGQKSAMIVRWNETVKQGSQTDAIIQYEDITPTLIEIAGGRKIGGLDGKSFLRILLNKSEKHRDFAYGIHNNIPEGPAYPIRSIRDDRYKLILNLMAEEQYHIRYMMNPEHKSNTGVWDSWLEQATQNRNAKLLTDRITHRPAVEFYDIKNDPWELHNLALEPNYSRIIKNHKKKLKKWMKLQGDKGAVIDKEYEKHG